MTPIKFCANISLLFTELPFLDRFYAAKRAGFKAVEIQFPYDFSVEQLLAAKREADIEVVLINVAADDLMSGGEGLAAVPEKTEKFEAALAQCVDYAKALEVSCVNVLAGRCCDETRRAEYLQTFIGNLDKALLQFKPLGITTCIEAINAVDMPDFLISDLPQMLEVLERVNQDGLAMQYDVYHMAMMGQPVAEQIERYVDKIGHVQFADCPGRHEPGTGKLDLVEIFSAIEASNYLGWVGAEYKPSVITEDTLYWL